MHEKRGRLWPLHVVVLRGVLCGVGYCGLYGSGNGIHAVTLSGGML